MCKTITTITDAPGKPVFVLFLQQEVITVRSSLILPKNQPISHCLRAWVSQLGSLSPGKDRKKNWARKVRKEETP